MLCDHISLVSNPSTSKQIYDYHLQGAWSNVLRGAGGALVLVIYDEIKSVLDKYLEEHPH